MYKFYTVFAKILTADIRY